MRHTRSTLVVVGHGMVGHRFVQAAIERGLTETHDIVVIGAERRPAYDRVALTCFFAAESADELSLLPEGAYDDPRVTLVLDAEVTEIDRAGRAITYVSPAPGNVTEPLTNPGRVETLAYDALVLATGAAPFVPPVEGRDKDGCFVYRTIEDLEAIRTASGSATSGIVIGGGLLGLEAANALRPARPGDPRRRDGAAADAGAARRRRRRDPGPPHREARRPRPRRRAHRGHHRRRRGDRAAGPPRRHRGGRRDDHGRRPGRGVLRRHPAPRRDRPRVRPRPRRARRRARRRAVPHLRPARLRDRRVRRPGRADVRPGGPGLRDGRGRRRRPARGPRHLHRRRHVHQAQAARRRRGQLRRRLRDHRPTRWSSSTPTPSRASTRSSSWPSRRTARSASSAASWSATRRRTACCDRSSRAASRCRPTRRS